MRKTWLVAFLAMASACTALAAAAGVSVSHAWIRLLPGNLPLAAYFDLRNGDDRALELVGAQSAEFGRIEMHRSMVMRGMDHMMAVSDVRVPAHGQLEFSPGGYHLMLFDPQRPLSVSEHVTIVLKFADGQSRPVSFVVKPAATQ